MLLFRLLLPLIVVSVAFAGCSKPPLGGVDGGDLGSLGGLQSDPRCLSFRSDEASQFVAYKSGASSANSKEGKQVKYFLPQPERVKSHGVVSSVREGSDLCRLDAEGTCSWKGWADKDGGSPTAFEAHVGYTNAGDNNQYPSFKEASEDARDIPFRVWVELNNGDRWISSMDTYMSLNPYQKDGFLDPPPLHYCDTVATGLWDAAQPTHGE